MTLRELSRARTSLNGVRPQLSVGFLLLGNFTLCAFANFVDVLRLASDEGDRSRQIRCNWKVISPDLHPIVSSCGVSVQPHELIGDLSRFDYVVVVGGVIDDQIFWKDDSRDELLRSAANLGVPLVGLCTGSLVLHRAGLMDGYRCCVSWFHGADFMSQFQGLHPVSDQIFVVDRDRLTCSGGVSTAHLAAFLVDRHLGGSAAMKSLRIMMLDGAANEETPQPAATLNLNANDPLVKKSLSLMHQNLEMPLSIQNIADRLGVEKRRVERRVLRKMGRITASVFVFFRFGQSRHLLLKSEKSVGVIAVECGFCDSAHLGRSFRREYGMTPQSFRLNSPKDTEQSHATIQL